MLKIRKNKEIFCTNGIKNTNFFFEIILFYTLAFFRLFSFCFFYKMAKGIYYGHILS